MSVIFHIYKRFLLCYCIAVNSRYTEPPIGNFGSLSQMRESFVESTSGDQTLDRTWPGCTEGQGTAKMKSFDLSSAELNPLCREL